MWVWGLSFVTSVLMYAFGRIGPSGDGTCWVERQKDPIRLLFFVPLLIYFSLSIGSLITAAIYSGATSTLSLQDRRGMLLRMCSYTLVFILCWIGPLAHRIAQWSGEQDNQNSPNAFMYWDAISVSIQGFMNAMVWLTNPSFFKGFTANIRRYLPCKGLRNEENIPLLRSLGDDSQDPTQLAVSLRNYVEENKHIESFSKLGEIPKEEKLYTEKDLFKDELNLQISTIKRHQVKDYDPKIYSAIRYLSGITPDDYLKSFDATTFFDTLSNQKFSEGKSGSFMCFTPDNRYLIKTITQQESLLLRKKMSKFYQYFSENRNSFLLRFYGSYKVTMPNDHTVYLAIMSNVFSSSKQKIRRRYDLKGSNINRGGRPDYDPNTLGLDLDFINTELYLRVPNQLKNTFLEQLGRDSSFLKSLNIMDYSLLIGIVPNPNPPGNQSIGLDDLSGSTSTTDTTINTTSLTTTTTTTIIESDFTKGFISSDGNFIYYIGIIDILQLYDFSKKMERFVKVYVVHKDKSGISAVPPDFYVERFMKRMYQIISPSQDV
ncbi:G-protein-coupled receptor family protein [Cavenderia fasciculata]|uniref:G-protein-coupled receptor family protein n=1 Tax=Cavenderia fasciculata TaxID=261658 RepID=F4PLB2_CACFS|nr:G-protein-coupled receptor family protein [Cavenderia fasciculata]EGG23334.1 G-protein-coupled receptor family protein [Cavenderia fasciculata]|eukprot:XP_004361185.1 G-protein-coupled receptor family protein [Cavenderia fasciculata]